MNPHKRTINRFRSPESKHVPVYYREDLAHIHHLAYGGYADSCAPGVLSQLEPYLGGTILELGCGSGALTRHLLDSGHRVIATDASTPMLDLARNEMPDADFRPLTLPHDPIPDADAIVSVGHALSYLDSAGDIESSVLSCLHALSAGGLLAVDLLDISYGRALSEPTTHGEAHEDWAIFLTKYPEGPDRFVREVTTFVRSDDGSWRRSDEVHQNTLVDVEALAGRLRDNGLRAEVRAGFGTERPEEGLLVLTVRAPA